MKSKILSLILCLAVLPAAAVPANQSAGKNDNARPQYLSIQKLMNTFQVISGYYVDTVNEPHVVDEAIKAMLHTLDPHSTYSDPEATRALTEPLQGNFSGIGIQFNMLDDTVKVIQTVVGGPSEKVGILAGDRIMTANDTLISGVKMPQADVMKRLRGPKGSVVKIGARRRGVPEMIYFTIERDDIPTYSVNAAYMADDNTGYIKATLFGETTAKELAEAIVKLQGQGMTDLVLDLEDNGGGYLQAAIDMASMLLDDDALIVYTDGRMAPATYYNASKAPVKFNGRLVVTVNQYSASASEILSGAVQDNDRGVIVGRRTFGKGLVQRPIPFPDGSMIRLTTARYYTPSGRLIQKPYKPGEDEDYELDIVHRYEAGEFNSADSVHFDESLLKRTLRNGRKVYGGGGIMPDAFVPVDTSYYSTYYRDLVAKAVINRYTLAYVDEHRSRLRREWPTADAFVGGFKVSQAMIDSIVALGEREGVKPDSAQLDVSRPAIELIVKGLIGRDLFEQSIYYRVVNPIDPIYRRALEIINDEKLYDRLLEGSPEVK